MTVAFLSSKFTRELPRTIHRTEHDGLVIDVRENSRYRWLTFGNGIVQSAMALADPPRLVLPYTQSMLAPLLFHDRPERFLLLGIGGGSLIRYLRSALPEARVQAVDSSPAVIETALEYFSLPPSGPGLRCDVADARETIASARGQDLILVDVFDASGMPPWVGEPGFLEAAREALGAEGILALNLMPSGEAELAEILRAARSVFDGRVLVTTLVDYHNVIVLGLRADPAELAVRELGRRASMLERRLHLPLARVLRNICGVNVCHRGRLVL